MTTSVRQVVGYAATQTLSSSLNVRQAVSYAAQQLPAQVTVRDSVAYAYYQTAPQISARDVFGYAYTPPLVVPQAVVRDISAYAYTQPPASGGVRNIVVYGWSTTAAPVPTKGSLLSLLDLINGVTTRTFALADLNYGTATADSSVSGTDTSVALTSNTGYTGTVTVHYNRVILQRLLPLGKTVVVIPSTLTNVNALIPYINSSLGLNLAVGDLTNDTLTPGSTSVTLTAASTSYQLEPGSQTTITLKQGTVALMNFEGSSIVDDAGITPSGSITVVGAAVSTAQKKIGNQSVLVASAASTANRFTFADNAAFHIAGDMTVEGYFFATVSADVLFLEKSPNVTAGQRFYLEINKGVMQMALPGTSASIIMSSTTMSINAWHHLAWVKHNNVWTAYLDGVPQLSTTSSVDWSANTSAIVFGNNEIASNGLIGYLDAIRISSVARYTGAFTPPTTPFVLD